MFKKDENLEKILLNKVISLVGPSSHLVGKDLGEQINKSEVVIRINDLMPLNYQQDYGDRTDVMVYNGSKLSLPWFENELMEKKKYLDNLKCVFVPTLKHSHQCIISNFFEGCVIQNVEEIKKRVLCNVYHIGVDNYKCFYNDIGCEPNSGLLTILAILQYDIKRLEIYGISFYSQNFSGYDCYYPGKVREEFQEIGGQFNPRIGHDQQKQFSYFRNVILQKYQNKIVMDEYLEQLTKNWRV